MHATEARDKAEKFNSIEVNKEMSKILGEICQAANNGKLFLLTDYSVSCQCANRLKDLGYKVEYKQRRLTDSHNEEYMADVMFVEW